MDKADVSILLVEDSPLLQDIVQKQLAFLGYFQVCLAENGKIAVDKAFQKRPDIILMDVMMPELDGLEATRIIRAEEAKAGAHTPIVAMTGFAEKERCFQSGMDDFLQKPVLLNSLKGALETWIKDLSVDIADKPIIIQRDKAETAESAFIETDKSLEAIRHRIDDLRRRFGLEK